MKEFSPVLSESGPPLRLQIDDDGELWLRQSDCLAADVAHYRLLEEHPFPWIGMVLAVPSMGGGVPYRKYCISELGNGVMVTADMGQEHLELIPVHLGRLAAGKEVVNTDVAHYQMLDYGDTSYRSLAAAHRANVAAHCGTQRMTTDRLRSLFLTLLINTPVADSYTQLV